MKPVPLEEGGIHHLHFRPRRPAEVTPGEDVGDGHQDSRPQDHQCRGRVVLGDPLGMAIPESYATDLSGDSRWCFRGRDAGHGAPRPPQSRGGRGSSVLLLQLSHARAEQTVAVAGSR